MKNFYLIIVGCIFFFNSRSQGTVNISASHDNTIYQELTNNSNGQGINIFSGANNLGNARRTLLKFNIGIAIPPNSTITAVTLTLHCNKTISGNFNMQLHKLVQNWGEGNSDAGAINDGTGATAAANDATWACSFANGSGGCSTAWSTTGGTYTVIQSATTSVGPINVSYNWSSTQMKLDVQEWLDDPAVNYGWILIGDETTAASAKRFESRQNSANQPVLTVSYIPTVPVTLVYFKGQETKYGNALNWETAQEINNAFFDIEHSNDGTHFFSIGKVNGAGTTSLPQSYRFIHSAPGSGLHYYRLAQTDIDGRISYSPIVAITLKKTINTILINPNPVKDKIVLQGFSAGKRFYTIFDFIGQKIKQGTISNEIHLPPTLSPGKYYLRIVRDDGQVDIGNFLKQ